MPEFLADKSALTRRETSSCSTAPPAGRPIEPSPLPDLLVAACAERASLAILHYDADFERIAALTGQPARWIVLRGSVA